MKNAIFVILSLVMLSGCAETGLDQLVGNVDRLSVCGECLDVIQDLQTSQTLQETNLNNVMSQIKEVAKNTD